MRSFVKLLSVVMLAGAIAGGWTAMSSPQKSHKHMEATDPFLWLEDVHGAKPLEWVKTQNTKSTLLLQRDADYRWRKNATPRRTASGTGGETTAR